MAKLFVSEAAWRCADRCVQAFGGRGYMRSNVAERFLRELRVDRIWEGTSEIQRLIVARGPRAPRRRADPPLVPDGAAATGPIRRRCSSRARSPSSARPTGPAPTATPSCATSSAAGFDGRGLGRQPEARRGARPADCVPSRRRAARAGRRGRRRDPGRRGAGRRSPRRPSAAAAARSCSRPASARSRRAATLERELREVAAGGRRCPVCGPNGNGIVAVAARAPHVGRLGAARCEPGRRRDDLPERQRRGQRARLAPRDRLPHGRLDRQPGGARRQRLARARSRERDGVRSVALFLEYDGDGARLAEALARCAERGVGVAVLKVGRLARRAPRAAAAHTGAARRRPAGLPGAGRGGRRRPGPRDPHELLELARVLAEPRARPARRRRARGPHLLRRGLGDRRRRGRAARGRAAAAGRRDHASGWRSCCPTRRRSATRSTTRR